MKLSMAVSTPDAKFSALALKGPYEDIFSFLKECGYDGAELSVRDPALIDMNELKGLLNKFDLKVPAVGTGRAFGEEGLSFSSADEKVRDAAVTRIKAQVDFCESLGANVIIGLIVGNEKRTSENEEFAIQCLKECSTYAATKSVRLVVEAINRYETSFITNIDICMNLLEKVGSPACGILFDTFHANIEEASITGSIKKAGSLIGHVHVADSNRWHPGAGHIDFRAIVDSLADVGYDGFLSAEIMPLPDPQTATRENAAYMRKIISSS